MLFRISVNVFSITVFDFFFVFFLMCLQWTAWLAAMAHMIHDSHVSLARITFHIHLHVKSLMI